MNAKQILRAYTPFCTPHKETGEILFMWIAAYASFANKTIAISAV